MVVYQVRTRTGESAYVGADVGAALQALRDNPGSTLVAFEAPSGGFRVCGCCGDPHPGRVCPDA